MLLVIGLSLLLTGILDLFGRWYQFYLERFNLDPRLVRLAIRLLWVIMAFLFWQALVSRHLVAGLSLSHFLFALFTYSLYRLIQSLSAPLREHDDKHTNRPQQGGR